MAATRPRDGHGGRTASTVDATFASFDPIVNGHLSRKLLVLGGFSVVDEIPSDLATARVYEHGWDSDSPAGVFPVLGRRPSARSGPARPTRFQGAGLLAVEAWPGGPGRLWSAPRPAAEVPSIRAQPAPGRGAAGARLVIRADGEVAAADHPDLVTACMRWAEGVAALAGVAATPALDPMWCAPRGLGPAAERALAANLAAMERLGLPVGVVLVGGAAVSAATSRLAGLVTGAGRTAGMRLSPFVVGARSRLAAERPAWLVGGATAGRGSRILDVTHPGAAEYLRDVVAALTGPGVGLLALDRLAAGALPGRRHADATALAAYREGLRLVREAAGPGVVLLGRGAPLLPSVGLVDAMRVGPSVPDPGGAALPDALRSGRAR